MDGDSSFVPSMVSTSLALLPFCSILVASKFPKNNPFAHRFAGWVAKQAGANAGYAFASLPVVTSGLGFGWLQVCQAAERRVREWEGET